MIKSQGSILGLARLEPRAGLLEEILDAAFVWSMRVTSELISLVLPFESEPSSKTSELLSPA